MKKKAFTIMMAAMIFVAGCGTETKEEPKQEVKATITDVDTEISYASMIPDPEAVFEHGDISITDADGGKMYALEVHNFLDTEYDTYVAACKQRGFTDISYDTYHERGADYGAYTKDRKYWVQVNLDAEQNVIYIICQTSKKKGGN